MVWKVKIGRKSLVFDTREEAIKYVLDGKISRAVLWSEINLPRGRYRGKREVIAR